MTNTSAPTDTDDAAILANIAPAPWVDLETLDTGPVVSSLALCRSCGACTHHVGARLAWVRLCESCGAESVDVTPCDHDASGPLAVDLAEIIAREIGVPSVLDRYQVTDRAVEALTRLRVRQEFGMPYMTDVEVDAALRAPQRPLVGDIPGRWVSDLGGLHGHLIDPETPSLTLCELGTDGMVDAGPLAYTCSGCTMA